MEATPATTDTKIKGTTSIRIRRTKTSPIHLRLTADSRSSSPAATPPARPMRMRPHRGMSNQKRRAYRRSPPRPGEAEEKSIIGTPGATSRPGNKKSQALPDVLAGEAEHQKLLRSVAYHQRPRFEWTEPL